MTLNESSLDVAKCPLCGRPNECQLCTAAADKGPCWCATVSIPEELLGRVPAELRNKACLCRNCVMEFHRAKEDGVAGPKIRPGDFYFDSGLMVFTAAYHQRRGYCCSNDCRHCPYQSQPVVGRRSLVLRTLALLLLQFVTTSPAATVTEDFPTNPAVSGRQIFGETNLFLWASTNQNLRVAWDFAQNQ